MDATTLTTEQKLKLAEKALLHLLFRIKNEDAVFEKLGAGTHTFELTTAALSAINGQPLDDVREKYAEGSAGICASMEDILETIH